MLMTFMTPVTIAQNIYETDITLPAPDKIGGKPLMQCLSERSSSRDFSSKELTLQEISNLLWAANGINRADAGKHTAPTAMNYQNMELYVILPKGIYLYDDKSNALKLINSGNFMKSAGKQDFVEKAPLNVIVVADMSKLGEYNAEQKMLYSGVHAGAIIQNIYLYCASTGLHTVVRAWFEQEELSSVLKLNADKRVILAQTVGYPN